MAYDVEGIIAKREVLQRHLYGRAWAKIAPLDQGFGLVPTGEAARGDLKALDESLYREFLEYDRVHGAELEETMARFDYLPSLLALTRALNGWLEGMSLDGPVAVIWIECFGGDCEHGAAVWKDGRRTHGPAVMESSNYSFDNPVNQALRLIGVEVGDSGDAFTAIGLAQHRHREDWEAAAV
jgi:hypothetical protein